jgi:hypothetical protein
MAGCLGAGDDSSTTPPISDASSDADAKAGEGGASADAHAKEGGEAAAEAGEASGPDATLSDAGGDGTIASPPVAVLSGTPLDFGAVNCGSKSTKILTIANNGGSPLVVSGSKVGDAFSVSTTSLTVPAGSSGTITLIANVSATGVQAATAVTGSLALFTNDPNNANIVLLLTATATGAQLSGTPLYAFAPTEIGVPAPPQSLSLVNTGNASATFTFGNPSDPSVTLQGLPSGNAVTVNPGVAVAATANFKPKSAAAVSATVTITPGATTCGGSLTSLTFLGSVATGSISGIPATIDFGLTNCGLAPAPKAITLRNTSAVDVQITGIGTSAIGAFTIDAAAGQRIPAGGSLVINFTAPPVPAAPLSLAPITASVVLHTDADSSGAGTTIALTEEPQGAILALGSAANCPSMPATFGAFGSAGVLLQAAPPQSFCIVNSGNAPANVILNASEMRAGDAGVAVSGDAGGDASTGPTAFSILAPTPTIPAPAAGGTPTVATDSITFTPVHAGATTGSLTMAVDSTTTLCQPLPNPAPLSGSATGGGPSISVSQVTFGAVCGGDAPTAETIGISNSGAVNMNWSYSGPTGPGAAQYTVMASPAPGLLGPGQGAQLSVTAAALPSPVTNPDPAALAAQLVITTDVPFDPPHVISLSEIPIGDQLFVTLPDPIGSTLRFGQVPVSLPVTRSFTVTNNANPGPGAFSSNVSLSVTGTGSAAYSQPAAATAAPGGSSTESITFNAGMATNYPATLSFSTSDPLCTPLPAPIALSGTGPSGIAQLSAQTLYFGTNPTDPTPANRGLVNCGAGGTPQPLMITNIGSQPLNLNGVTWGKGTATPFSIAGGAVFPINLAIGASVTWTILPAAIPQTVANPNDALAFSDTLTIGTDSGGSPIVQLVMQPRGAIISGSQPPATWSFGTIGEGSIGTFSGTAIHNSGNAPASVSLQPASPFSLPSVFSLQNSPVALPPGDTGLVGQFTPNAPNASWSGTGVLDITADAFCSPLPMIWNMPQISMSGASSSNPLVAISGNLVFPSTDCGASPPGGQSVTLTNMTNQGFSYTIKFASGTFYTFIDGGSGTLVANGTATIVVNPKFVVPGPGVFPGSAPYADDLVITVETMPAMTLTQPISWTLSGAVLSLPQGAGPFVAMGTDFYAADTNSGFPLQISNTGTATATLQFVEQPTGAFSLVPAQVQVIPGIPAAPELVASASSPACPTTNNGTASFVYSGPVCQPLPFASVAVDSCAGTFSGQSAPPPPPPMDAGADSAPDDAGPSGASDGATSSDAGDGGSGAPTPCTSDPCAASGANSVQCFATAAGNGVCTGTEAVIVQRDIAKGNLTAGQLTQGPSGSCYGCLANSLFITSSKQCESLSGTVGSGGQAAETKTQACLNTLSCILGVTDGTYNSCGNDPPPGTGVSNCYCGSNYPTVADCNGASGVAAPPVNGSCAGVIEDGLGDTASTPGSTVLGTIVTSGLGAGRADAILKAAGTSSATPPCALCYQ